MATRLTYFRLVNRGQWLRLVYIGTITFVILLVGTFRPQSFKMEKRSKTIGCTRAPIFKLLTRRESMRLQQIAKMYKENMYALYSTGQTKRIAGGGVLWKTNSEVSIVTNVGHVNTFSRINKNTTTIGSVKQMLTHYAASVPNKNQKILRPNARTGQIKQKFGHHVTGTVSEKQKMDYNNKAIAAFKKNNDVHTKVFSSVQQKVDHGASPTTSAKQRIDQSTTITTEAKPKILLWFLKREYQPIMKELQTLAACPQARCRITTNWKHYYSSSALIFSAQSVTWQSPPPRRSNQIWILYNHESPTTSWIDKTTLNVRQWKGLFNWTMDYRNDSDIVVPYRILQKRMVIGYKNYSSVISQKIGPVSWLVSNCYAEDNRDKYVTKLQNYISVKVFGSCLGTPCHGNRDVDCLQRINTFKFYLAFEDAVCPDYLTESFFRWFSADVVFVVRGGVNYTNLLPEGTYIDTTNFQTVRDLANYLVYLDKHDDKYIEYLKRKNEYRSVYEEYIKKNDKGDLDYVHYYYDQVPLCNVCDRLWNLDRYRRTYQDIGRWFEQGRCYTPNDTLH